VSIDRLARQLRTVSGGDLEVAAEVLRRIEEQARELHYARYFTPYGGQNEVIKHLHDKKIVLVLGGNRAGKTTIGSWVAACWFLGKNYFVGSPAWNAVKDLPIPDDGGSVWVVGLDFPTVRDVIWREHLVGGLAHPPFLNPRNPAVDRILERDFQIHGKNRQLLTCKSAESGRPKFQGASLDLIWLDEECDADIFDECYQRTLDRSGKIIVTATPLGDIAQRARRPWLYELYVAAQNGAADIGVVQLSVFDNLFLPADERARLLDKWDGHPEGPARLYGKFIQRVGLVYPMFDPAKHVITPFRLPIQWPRWVSIDPAATGPTAALWAAVDPVTGDVYFYREYFSAEKTVSEHAANILIASGGERIDYWLIDPKWGAQRNAESHKTGAQLYRERGIPVRLAKIDADYGLGRSMEYMLATTRESSHHPRVYFFDTLDETVRQIKSYVWDTYASGPQAGMSKQRPRKGDDDLMNAMQYLLATLPVRRRDTSTRVHWQKIEQKAKFNSYT